MVAETNWATARKFRASFSYRVAMARKCLILLKNRSMRLPRDRVPNRSPFWSCGSLLGEWRV